ncbi:MAG: hypothetical protein J6U60_01600 [Clostridia bacterium]|nr:hypothetical protein [Clostridia bacterium]
MEEQKSKKKKKSYLVEGHSIKAYFNKIFSDSQPYNEKKVLIIAKWALFVLLFMVEILALIQGIEGLVVDDKRWLTFILLASVVICFNVIEIFKLFVLVEKQEKYKWLFYALEIISACAFVILVEGVYSIFFFILILTQFYFSTEERRSSIGMFGIALPLYAVSYVFQVYITKGDVNSIQIFRESLAILIGLSIHFVAVQLVLAFYLQYVTLNRTLKELDESKKELEKAYAVVAEVSALEERQRIAKDIHDTAGHSLATVIMQTEAAKRIIDENPEDAKLKIEAANIQAKHTLERLRESIHLLSNAEEQITLKSALEKIIHETTDGTGITIRSYIENAEISPAKFRFLCNTLKEGLSNGLRHGKATAFWFELKAERGYIYFLLSDNGIGISGNLVAGFGLTAMAQKASTFGGEVKVVSEPNEGFELYMFLPEDERNEYGQEN